MRDLCGFVTLVFSSRAPFRVSRVGLKPTTFTEIGVHQNEDQQESGPLRLSK